MENPLVPIQLQHKLHCEFPNSERQLVIFRRQYLQRINIKNLAWPSDYLLSIYDVQRWIYGFILNPWHSISRTNHDREVLIELVKRIERAVADVEEPDLFDPIVELCAHLCAQPRSSVVDAAQCDMWIVYETVHSFDMVGHNPSIQLYEKPRVLSASGCTGYRTWEAALALAGKIGSKWISQNMLCGKKVLELGAGTGLLSFLCAMPGCADRIVATDGDEDAVTRLVTSNGANGTGVSGRSDRIKFGIYRWAESFEETIIGEELADGFFDVVLAADVTYDPTSVPALVATVRKLVDLNPSTVVIFSAALRNPTTFHSFLDACGRIKPIPSSGIVANNHRLFRSSDEDLLLPTCVVVGTIPFLPFRRGTDHIYINYEPPSKAKRARYGYA